MLSNYSLGLLYVGLFVCIWTAAGFATQYLETTLDFDYPFLFTWISQSLFSINLPLHFVLKTWCSSTTSTKEGEEEDVSFVTTAGPASSSSSSSSSALGADEADTSYYQRQQIKSSNSNETPKYENISGEGDEWRAHQDSKWWIMRPLEHDGSFVETLQVALVLAPLLFLGNLFYNNSLEYTSISSSIVITNLNGSFTLLFSSWCGVEDVTRSKIFGVLLCFTGILIVGAGDRDSDSSVDSSSYAIYGDFCALLGAVCYGLYTTLVKLKIRDNRVDVSTVMGYVGIVTMLGLAPVVFALYITHSGGVDQLNASTLLFVVSEEMLDAVAANFFYAKATILASPSVAAVGESLTIPMSIVAEASLRATGSRWAGEDDVVTWFEIIGGAFVACGFSMLVLDNPSSS